MCKNLLNNKLQLKILNYQNLVKKRQFKWLLLLEEGKIKINNSSSNNNNKNKIIYLI